MSAPESPAADVAEAPAPRLRWWHRWFPASCHVPLRCMDGGRDHDYQTSQVAHDAYVDLCVSCLDGWGSYYRGPDRPDE